MTNCTFSGNTATQNGGGMYISEYKIPTMTNCTFSGNTATSGDGMYITANSSATVTNTIFLGANDVTGQVVYKGGKPTITCSVVDTTLFTDPTNTAADPKLEPLADNSGPTKTCALLEGSSAIDKGLGVGTYKIDGVDIEVPTTDQRGAKRPQPAGGTVDIGAYEFEVGTLTVTINPEKARTEGAKWSHDGATWHYSEESVHLVPGDYTVTFETITGWTEPASLNVTVIGGMSIEDAGEYTPDQTPMPTPGPAPKPTPAPVPTPTPAPNPTPVPLQPVDPPEGANFLRATPLTVTLPPNPTEEQKKDALRKAFREALVPNVLIEDLLELLTVDDSGQVYISDDGMERLRELLDDLEPTEEAKMSPLSVIRASLDAQGTSAYSPYSPETGTAVFFFELPSCYTGLRCDHLQVVKAFSSERAALFERVYQLEDLRDRCAAVVEIKGKALKRVLGPSELITPSCRLALAIKDGGTFDLDGMENGFLVDPAFVVAGEAKSDPDPSGGGGGGCATRGFAPALLILLSPLALLTVRK